MTENQKAFFGEACDLDAWKKDIEAMREQNELSFEPLSSEEKEHLMIELKNATEDFKRTFELRTKLHVLIDLWQERQRIYLENAKKEKLGGSKYCELAYKGQATRDCWEELLQILNEDKEGNL